MNADQRFRPEDRLRKATEYERVLSRKCNVRGKHLLLFGCPNDLARTRLGRIVNKRWGNAVVRNRYRRWFREAFRQLKASLPQGFDLVLMPHLVEGMNFHTIKEELPKLAAKLVDRFRSTS